MIIAFIGGGGGGAVIILLLVAFALISLLALGVILLACRKKLAASVSLILFGACLTYLYLGSRPIDYHKYSSTSIEVESDTGLFEVKMDGVVRSGPANLRNSEFTLICDGVKLEGKAHATMIDQGERERLLLNYSINTIKDGQAFRRFLEDGFQVEPHDEDGSIQRGDFTFIYTTRVDDTQDFQIIKTKKAANKIR